MNFLKACLVTIATVVVFPVFGKLSANPAPSYVVNEPNNEIAYRGNRVHVHRGGYHGHRTHGYGYRPYYYNTYYRTQPYYYRTQPYYRNYYYNRTYADPYYYRDRDSGIYFRIGL